VERRLLYSHTMSQRKTYITPAERGLFDGIDRLKQIDKMGDVLADLDHVMDWNVFLPVLERIPREEPKGPGGRPAYHPLLMFKVLVLQDLHNLSDEQTQYQIMDRRSFARFLGLTDADRVPDQNTIRGFRETLTHSNLVEELFEAFAARLLEKGFVTRKGNIVDASMVEVPVQRNRRGENETIKNGAIPDGWQDNPKRLAHKDIDARWTQKNGVSFFGYKNHVCVDMESKLIVRAIVTDASVHDSQALDAVTAHGDPPTYADSAYTGPACEMVLESKEIDGVVCERGARNRPLTGRQKQTNRAKARKRSRVEHVFGFMTGSMNAMRKRYVGIIRNRASVILSNLVYNMARAEQIIRLRLLGRRTPSLA
jgi:IS5 family transposase